MRFEPGRIEEFKKTEEHRFLTASIPVIAVKSAPWAAVQGRFGLVRRPRGNGPVTVNEDRGNLHEYPSVTAMLDDWIGD